jgi:serine/threonine-protein kinase
MEGDGRSDRPAGGPSGEVADPDDSATLRDTPPATLPSGPSIVGQDDGSDRESERSIPAPKGAARRSGAKSIPWPNRSTVSKSEVDSILKRFAPNARRARTMDSSLQDKTLDDAADVHRGGAGGVHAPIAYDETVEVKRRPVRAPDERVGTTIAGRYRLLRVLGAGGMGTVYEAKHLGLGKHVAVKILTALTSRHDEASARFLREARTSSSVESEHIVHVFDVGEDLDAGMYMVMELLKGEDVASVLEQRQRLPSETAAGIAWQVSLALERAHAAGIVHRDLKPANVFVTKADDGSMKIKVLDFGIAKLVRDAKGERQDITREGSAIGTPQYMSPEQAQGLPTVDARADYYSLGALLFECITGKAPYPELPTYEQTILKIMMEAPPRASSLVPEIDPAIDQLIADLMERAPSARPASLAVVRERLTAVHVALPSQRMVLGSAPWVRPGGSAVVRTGGGVAVASRRVVQPSKTRRRKALLVAIGTVLVAAACLAGLFLRGVARRGEPAAVAATAPTPSQALMAEARRLQREGRTDLACADYEQASDAEPNSGTAALDASLCFLFRPELGREYFRRGWAAREGLSTHEAALLEALEAKFQRGPEDDTEWIARLRALSVRFPSDAQFHFLLSRQLSSQARLQDAVDEMNRAIALDPGDPAKWELLSDQHAYLGEFATALAETGRCLEIAPGDLGCIEERGWIDGEAGRCAAVETDGRRMLSIDANSAEGTSFVANALYARGSPLSAIEDILRRRRERLAESEKRLAAKLADDILVAQLGGDFVAAETLARKDYEAVANSTDALEHGRVARVLVSIEEELGHTSEASTLAAAYLARRDGWESRSAFDDWAMANEPTPLMLAIRMRGGDLAPAAFERARSQAIERWASPSRIDMRGFAWIYGYAVPAETPAEAARASDVLPSYQPLPAYTPLSLVSADIGRALFLAGHVSEAVPQLERATRNCFPLDHPIEHTRAHYFLGLAREAQRDKAAACLAYGVVRDRWANVDPSGAGVASVTAKKALARMSALGCKP